MRSFWFAFLLFTTAAAFGQVQDVANKIYNSSQNSVFLVYLNDSTGSPDALGSAFLVASRVLVTNAHVADAGNPVLAVGPVRIPLKIIRIDRKNDLALLSVDVDLTSSPLPLASGEPHPGDQIFAIGNPEGLEKTISEGIVSGIRKIDDRNLLQITSPISHGSSGGPILNAKGEVVGVAVGMLEDGQNLNFAVPVIYVQSILKPGVDTPVGVTDVSASLAETKDLLTKREQDQYSNESDSDYQKDTRLLLDSMQATAAAASAEDVLRDLACLGTKAIDLSDVGIRAAQKLVQKRPSPENRALLAYVLYDRSQDEYFAAVFAKKGSSEETQANAARERFLSKASLAASEATHQKKGDGLLVASFVLANAKQEQADYADAISLYSPVAEARPIVCGVDLAPQAYRDLITASNKTDRPADAEMWFRRYTGQYTPSAYDWDSEGDRRYAALDFSNASDAYEKAAEADPAYHYDYCYAAASDYFQTVTDQDGILTNGRKCVDASVSDTTKEDDHYFKSEMPLVYRAMAQVLEKRGVYQPALEYIKESLAAQPNEPFALNTEATIFSDLERYSECVSAAQAAIAASDGKYPSMQFQLGYCYFSVGNWSQAATSFRLAADADKTDAVSAFNLGLCLSRQGYDADAQEWFREALNRKPDDELRTKILNLLK